MSICPCSFKCFCYLVFKFVFKNINVLFITTHQERNIVTAHCTGWAKCIFPPFLFEYISLTDIVWILKLSHISIPDPVLCAVTKRHNKHLVLLSQIVWYKRTPEIWKVVWAHYAVSVTLGLIFFLFVFPTKSISKHDCNGKL